MPPLMWNLNLFDTYSGLDDYIVLVFGYVGEGIRAFIGVVIVYDDDLYHTFFVDGFNIAIAKKLFKSVVIFVETDSRKKA